jgi:hypothetical protein
VERSFEASMRASRTPRPNILPISGIVLGPRRITTMIRTTIRIEQQVSHVVDGNAALTG